MWFLVLLVCITRIEQVVLQGGNRVILKNGNSNPCEGHVEIYHNSEWGYVGDEGWNSSTEEVVCSSTHCGKPVGCTTDVQIPTKRKIWLNEMTCSGDEKNLWDCSPPGWGISVYRKPTVKKIKCSDRINITLDGFWCAGAVQYTRNGVTGYLCGETLSKEKADRLCESLSCGKSKETPQQEWMVLEKFKSRNNMMIQCSGIENHIDHLWQCVTQESKTCEKPAFVVCEGYEKLQLRGNSSNVCTGILEKKENGEWKRHDITTSSDLWCKQMHCGTKIEHNETLNSIQVTCSDKIKVQLVGDDPKSNSCYGSVSVSLNGRDYSVCNTKWNAQAGGVVCQELNCGKVIVAEGQSGTRSRIMDQVNCLGNEASLWHCQAKHGTNLQCPSVASVVCEKSLDVRLTDGPGRCAGRVEILYKGKWMRVRKNGWTDNNSDSVCNQLNCGNKQKTERFSQGSSEFFPRKVECEKNTSHISECIKQPDQSREQEAEAVGVTCEKHKFVFLKGSTSCSGLVGIEDSGKTYWLSGSNKTWNEAAANLVCQQRGCGSSRGFGFISSADMKRDVWRDSLSCSSKHKSLFECDRNDPAPDHNATIANVTCSGGITVNLSNGCWGRVNVTISGQSGGVCADAWTEAQSLMLCKDLGCGDRALTPSYSAGMTDGPVLLKSLHETKDMTKLSQCNFVKNNERTSPCKSAYVVCSGSLRTKLSDSRDDCSGNVLVQFEEKWLPVCENALSDDKTRETICQELGCGSSANRISYLGTQSDGRSITELQCDASDKGLKACNVTSAVISCKWTGLQCSKWSKKALSDSCRGAVFAHGSDGSRPVSTKNWTKDMGDSFCSAMSCGKMKTNYMPQQCYTSENQSTLPDSITCEHEPKVTLSKPCRGVVKIDGTEVCSTNWMDDYSHMVCHERGCSNAVAGVDMVENADPKKQYHHVMCEDFHHKLGQCKRHKGKCVGKLVSVSCVKSVKFRTTENCGSDIEVDYQDKWEKVCLMDKTPGLQNFMNKLCNNIGCGDYNASITGTKPKQKEISRTKLDYTEDHMDIVHSVRVKACEESTQAQIFCNGYEPPPVKPVETPVPVVSIMLGLGVVLILVILVVIFVRIWFIKKRRNTMKPSLGRRLSQTEMEIESGEFDQIKDSETESLTRFRPEADVIVDNNRPSTPSLPYDDIDDMTQAQTAASSGHEEADGVTYEVDDLQESYDDVDAVTQTTAEVHDNSHPAPGGSAAASHQPQRDDDYLVPDQDG